MQPELRARFNADFSAERYAALLRGVNETERWPADFRISETPVFLTPEFVAEMADAAREIIARLRAPEFAVHARDAIPPGLAAPGETAHPAFVQVDFAVCEREDGSGLLTPRLIELQGFPSLYAFQPFLLRCLRDAYPAIPADLRPYFSGLDTAGYRELLRRVIVGDADPETVILLEIEPAQQKTRIDFACTESLLGVRPVDLAHVVKHGRKLFCRRETDGREIPVARIYNRVILDELLRRPEVQPGFRFNDEVDTVWVGHPNWYFRISKHSLPYLKTPHCSPAFFADEFPASERLEDYVLKPLYSFAGLGVDMAPTPEKLAALGGGAHAWILQKKVTYAEFLPTADGGRAKAELRLMFIWPEDGEPILANNLARMSRGAMMGVDFNRNKTWVGSSIALHAGE